MNTKKYKYDFLIFIGRFRPFHKGHKKIIDKALKLSKNVIVLPGSAYRPRTFRNPWTVDEVIEMISLCYTSKELERITFAPIRDFLYNDSAWTINIQAIVNGIIAAQHEAPHITPKIGLIGYEKDNSSYYLKLFPQWSFENVENTTGLNATDIREEYFINNKLPNFSLPEEVRIWVERWSLNNPNIYNYIKEEEVFCRDYKDKWSNSPYPPIFNTVDAVVIQSAHILLVERKARPGKGLLALPGGFVRQDETLLDGCIRELKEETKLKIPKAVLKGSIKDQHIFDYPKRSARGRTISYAYYFQLRADNNLPTVKGSDDAYKAFWLPISEIDSNLMYEDHYFIIQRFIKTM